MRQLLYVSAAAPGFVRPELNAILAAARRNNPRRGVTGLLLHIDQGFLQVPEGPDDGVAQIFAAIVRDPRHRAPSVLVDRPRETRLFADWSMGFDEPVEGRDGPVFQITREAVAGAVAPDKARDIATLLHAFYFVNAGDRLGLTPSARTAA